MHKSKKHTELNQLDGTNITKETMLSPNLDRLSLILYTEKVDLCHLHWNQAFSAVIWKVFLGSLLEQNNPLKVYIKGFPCKYILENYEKIR